MNFNIPSLLLVILFYCANIVHLEGASNTTKAIACYQCNSYNDARCAEEKPPKDLLRPCGPKDTMCRIISQDVEFNMYGKPPDSRVIRGCAWDESSFKGSCYKRSGFGGSHVVCSCLEDGCNSASTLGATLLMMLTVAVTRI